MKLSADAQNLLNSYLLELKRHLPKSQRADISAERESHILDMLSEKYADQENIEKKEMFDTLTELGDPKKLAATYYENQYLISPALYPYFTVIAKIVLTVLACVLLGISLMDLILNGTQTNFAGFSMNLLAELWNALMSALGTIVIVFYIIQKYSSPDKFKSEIEKESREWNPEELPKPIYTSAPGKSEAVMDIGFYLLFIIFLIFITIGSGIPIINIPDTENARLIAPKLTPYLPWLIILGLPGAIKSAYYLITDKWHQFTKIVDIVSNYLTVIALGLMISVRPLFILPTASSAASSESITKILPLVNGSVTLGLSIAALVIFILATIEAVKYIRMQTI